MAFFETLFTQSYDLCTFYYVRHVFGLVFRFITPDTGVLRRSEQPQRAPDFSMR